MDNINRFFIKLYSRPSLIWKAAAGILFISLAIAIFFVPSITNLEDSPRMGFSALMLLYGLYRFSTFYVDYNRRENED